MSKLVFELSICKYCMYLNKQLSVLLLRTQNLKPGTDGESKFLDKSIIYSLIITQHSTITHIESFVLWKGEGFWITEISMVSKQRFEYDYFPKNNYKNFLFTMTVAIWY